MNALRLITFSIIMLITTIFGIETLKAAREFTLKQHRKYTVSYYTAHVQWKNKARLP